MNTTSLDLSQRYPVTVRWSEPDGEFVATTPAFPYLSALAPSEAEALAEFRIVLQDVVEIAEERGMPLPDPEPTRTYSGNLRVRLPKSLHRDLDTAAHADNVSLNTFIVTQLSRAIGRPPEAV